jgi:prefoldin subunit 5
MTDQQKHLQQLIEQSNQLATEINSLSNQIATKRELFLKVQGVIEYLEQTGTTLPEPETEKKEEEIEESPEEQ